MKSLCGFSERRILSTDPLKKQREPIVVPFFSMDVMKGTHVALPITEKWRNPLQVI